MTEENRGYCSAEDKVNAIKRHLIDKEPVSSICDDLGIHPNRFYEWQTKFFTEGKQIFSSSKDQKVLEKKVEKLTQEKVKKDEVIGELLMELIEAKKKIGES